MRTVGSFILLAVPVFAHAADIHVGDSAAEVRNTLGAPDGQAEIGNKLVLFYSSGQVQVTDGKVTKVNFRSAEDIAAEKADASRAAQLRDQRVVEGKALKARILADPAFANSPPSAQLSFWRYFHLHYPEVPCDDEYHLALARAQAEPAPKNPPPADLSNVPYPAYYAFPYDYGYLPYRYRGRDRDNDEHDRDRSEHHDNRAPRNRSTELVAPSSSLPGANFSLPTPQVPPVPSFNLQTPFQNSPYNSFPQR